VHPLGTQAAPSYVHTSEFLQGSIAHIPLTDTRLIAISFSNLSIEVEMTIEPPSSVGMAEIKGTPSPKKRLRAVLSVEGYILPDPEVPNRLTGKLTLSFSNFHFDLITQPHAMTTSCNDSSLVHRYVDRENEHFCFSFLTAITNVLL